MTKDQSLLFRFLLFLAGIGILILAFFLTKGGKELNRIDAFKWVSIVLMYFILFIPLFFSSLNIGNFSGKIPSLGIVWFGIFLYIIASVAVIILLIPVHKISFNAAVIIQSILLFLFAVNTYLAYFASSHARSAAEEEAGKQQTISQLKPKAQSLLLSVNRLPEGYENAQKILRQSIEDIRYIYPVNDGAGDDLESDILRSLEIISELCKDIQDGAKPKAFEKEAENLQIAVKERKLMKN